MDHSSHEGANRHSTGQYRQLVAMTVLSFIAMYALMYAMVNAPNNVFANVNQVHMAGLMGAPMVVIELVLMRAMYRRKGWNAGIIAASVVTGVVFFIGIRRQLALSDKQFLRSMIPHHAGAILMCEHASIRDAETQKLCRNIIADQQAEIDQMKAKLQQLTSR